MCLNYLLQGHFEMRILVCKQDDFIPCPFAIDEMHRVLEHLDECSARGVAETCMPTLDASRHSTFHLCCRAGYSSISFSKGMNAIAIPMKKVPKLVKYLEDKITVLPPDLLIYAAWDGVADVHYSNDLFTHLGWFSSFEFRNAMNFGKKYNKMRGAGEKCYTKRQRYTYVVTRTEARSGFSSEFTFTCMQQGCTPADNRRIPSVEDAVSTHKEWR